MAALRNYLLFYYDASKNIPKVCMHKLCIVTLYRFSKLTGNQHIACQNLYITVGLDLLKIYTNIVFAIFSNRWTMAAVLFVLTVILTNIRKQCGPMCLKNMCLCVIYAPWITKPYSSRPDVAVMDLTI